MDKQPPQSARSTAARRRALELGSRPSPSFHGATLNTERFDAFVRLLGIDPKPGKPFPAHEVAARLKVGVGTIYRTRVYSEPCGLSFVSAVAQAVEAARSEQLPGAADFAIEQIVIFAPRERVAA